MGEIVLKDNITINYFADRKHTEKKTKRNQKNDQKKMFLLHGVRFVQNIYDLQARIQAKRVLDI